MRKEQLRHEIADLTERLLERRSRLAAVEKAEARIKRQHSQDDLVAQELALKEALQKGGRL
jgi:hypothetical protein